MSSTRRVYYRKIKSTSSTIHDPKEESELINFQEPEAKIEYPDPPKQEKDNAIQEYVRKIAEYDNDPAGTDEVVSQIAKTHEYEANHKDRTPVGSKKSYNFNHTTTHRSKDTGPAEKKGDRAHIIGKLHDMDKDFPNVMVDFKWKVSMTTKELQDIHRDALAAAERATSNSMTQMVIYGAAGVAETMAPLIKWDLTGFSDLLRTQPEMQNYINLMKQKYDSPVTLPLEFRFAMAAGMTAVALNNANQQAKTMMRMQAERERPDLGQAERERPDLGQAERERPNSSQAQQQEAPVQPIAPRPNGRMCGLAPNILVPTLTKQNDVFDQIAADLILDL